MPPPVFDQLAERLRAAGIEFEVLHHEPVYTSAQAADVRGTPLSSGAKALVCKADDGFLMFVVPADRRLDSKRVRKANGWRSLRFASADEVLQLTGLTPGSIPPFGSLFGLATTCDGRLGEHEKINFNAGDHAVSISMRWHDYLAVEKPVLDEVGE